MEMTNKKIRFSWTIVAALVFIFSGQALGASVTPLEQMKGTVQGILAIMQDKKLDAPELRDERREKIMALVNERFDFTEMSKMTLGRAWKERSDEEKNEFERLFADLLKNTYIGRIEAYSDEKVEYAKEIFSRNDPDRARVYTNILKNSHTIPINYSLKREGEEWFVYDVIIEGVSLVRNYRTEFGRILSKENFSGLVKRMREKIASNEAERAE